MYSIDEELITVSLDGGETLAIMTAIAFRLQQLNLEPRSPERTEELYFLQAVTEKLHPHIKQKAMKQSQLSRDELN